MAAPSSSHSLKEYLKRYQSCTDDPKTAKKKKKKEKPKPKSTGCGVLVVDEDPVWHKPVQLDDAEEEDNYTAEETPQVEVDIEVKRMKRLEVLRSLKPYHSINEDGSGWVSIPKPSGLSTAKNRDLSPQQNQNDSGNADLSPLPYQRRRRFDSPLMEMIDNPADSNTDLSPPCQRRRRLDTPSPEPQLNGPGGEASDQSPPRRRRAEDLSPPRRAKPRTQEVEAGRGLPEADLSPPRKKGQRPVVDLSPPRRHRESPEADSYPLSMTRKGPSNDFAPRRARSSPAADLSPPRRTRKGSSDDLSPRRDRKRSLKPTEVQSTSLSDLSHSMRGEYGSSENLSLPRRARHGSSEGSRNSYLPSADLSTVRIKESSLTNDERRGGLLSAKEMKEEIDRKRKQEKSRFASMNPLLTGRDAEAVHRDKEGKKISKEELKKSKQEEKKKEKPLEWGKGLAQKREAEERGKELELEKERPFARSRDDPELEMMLKERIRWGDPMAHLVKPKNSELILEDLGENEKMKESGFIIPQTIPSHSWLKRGLDFTPNRYGIRPGRHWDGVDRSSGYEKELFKRQNDKRATETEAYLWSVSDM